jgi:hypothetical protein
VLFLALGIAGIAVGIIAPPEKKELAHLAIGYGAASVGIGVIIGFNFWLAPEIHGMTDLLLVRSMLSIVSHGVPAISQVS